MGELAEAEFSTSEIENVFACSSVIKECTDKRRSRLDSAHIKGLKTILYEILMAVETGGAGTKTKPMEIFQRQKLEMFLRPLPQPASYAKMGTTAGLYASNRSRNTLPRSSKCS